MKKYCLALDLVEDQKKISEYEMHHQNVWPEILHSITDSGISKMEIFRVANRLFMIIETLDHFSFEQKAAADLANPKVQEWEHLMWTYQQPLPLSKPGEKWRLMTKIFDYE